MTGMKKASSTRRLEPQPTATMQTMLRTEPAVSSWDHDGALDTETRIRFRNDNNANWQAYPLYTSDGEWNVHMKDVGTTYTMVNKNASDDVKKAIVIMNNVLVRDESTLRYFCSNRLVSAA